MVSGPASRAAHSCHPVALFQGQLAPATWPMGKNIPPVRSPKLSSRMVATSSPTPSAKALATSALSVGEESVGSVAPSPQAANTSRDSGMKPNFLLIRDSHVVDGSRTLRDL